MRIELVRDWTNGGRVFPAGKVLDQTDGVAEFLISRGTAKRLEEVAEPPRRRRPGRPRKEVSGGP